MARNTESDGTYCSEVEKEDRKRIRRSKRLSQRNLLSSFRSNGDPITERLYEIYQLLKCGDLCSKWSIDDWKSLKFEVESIKEMLKGKRKGRISFILKKINQNLQKSSQLCPNESPAIIQFNQNNDEQVKSPNILAGMMTEVFTEIPPYQPENTVKNSEPIIALTQKNPLDLTKKNLDVQVVPDKVLSQNISERQKQTPTKIRTPVRTVPFEKQEKVKTPTDTSPLCISKDSMIDLTDEAIETNRENIDPGIKETTVRPKSPVHVSKWLQFLPTQQRPTCTEKIPRVTTSTIAPRKNSKSLKDSIVKLYKDQPAAITSISNPIQKPPTSSCPKKQKHIQKPNSTSIKLQSKENLSKKSFRNTENIITRDPNVPRVSPRNVQSENFGNISPDFLFDEFLDYSASDMNESGASFTSLEEGFRKVFGTDKLKDILVGDEKIYNLKESHVKCLATALKVEYGTLKKTIEHILSNDDIMQSDSSVVECSQSPPQRLFPSQRSQT